MTVDRTVALEAQISATANGSRTDPVTVESTEPAEDGDLIDSE